MKSVYTKALDNIREQDFLLVGGKGMNLGKMISAGLPVPGGFIVTTKSYEAFVKNNGLKDRIMALVADISTDDLDKIEHASQLIGELFTMGEIPDDIKREIGVNYEMMGDIPVAVRSSATAEDLPGTSFAGQYDTFLNIRGLEALYEAIKACWASLWNVRSLSYRIKYGIENDTLAHGVVIQKLVSGEKAGVLFTANPVNSRRDEMLINASWGLGEAVVSGEVSPDQWVIRWDSRVVEKFVAKKKVMTVRDAKGTHSEPVPRDLQEVSVLSEGEVKKLLELGKKTKKYFGDHQDMEWVILGSDVFLVQTRPITSLFPLVESKDDKFRIYMNFNTIAQGIYEPFTAMGQELMRLTYYETANAVTGKETNPYPEWVKNVGGRVFLELSHVVGKKKTWSKVATKLEMKDPLAGKVLMTVLEANEKEVLGSGLRFKFPLSAIGYFFRMMEGAKIAKRSYKDGERYIMDVGKQAIEEIKGDSARLKTTEEKLRFISKKMNLMNDVMYKQIMPAGVGLKSAEKAEKLLSKWLDKSYNLEAVFRYLPNNPTTTMGFEMLQIAKMLDEQGKKAEADQPLIKAFLKRYGHRAQVEIDLGFPRWQEEPEYVLSLINSYIETGTINENLKKFESGVQEAEMTMRAIVDEVKSKKGQRAAKKMEDLLMSYRRLAGLREYPKFCWSQSIQIFREVLLTIGDDLVRLGRLDKRNDIFHVKFRDIESGKKLQGVVQENKEAYKKFTNIRNLPRFITTTGECIYSLKEETDGNSLDGIPVSPGVYEGKVRVIFDPKGAKLEKGEILVTQSTNPAWTPLFLNAGALIMDTGGPISHGSIVAREYGIPAVVGVSDATRLLKDGQIIRVNGESGQVVIV